MHIGKKTKPPAPSGMPEAQRKRLTEYYDGALAILRQRVQEAKTEDDRARAKRHLADLEALRAKVLD